jgi:hypothetical protein
MDGRLGYWRWSNVWSCDAALSVVEYGSGCRDDEYYTHGARLLLGLFYTIT